MCISVVRSLLGSIVWHPGLIRWQTRHIVSTFRKRALDIAFRDHRILVSRCGTC